MDIDESKSNTGVGGLLKLGLRPTGSVVWVGPAWAVLCGAVASGALERDWHLVVSVLLAVILADPVLSTVWSLATRDEYYPASGASNNPSQGFTLPTLPYTLPDSIAGRLRDLLGERLTSWRSTVWPRAGQMLLAMGFASAVALLIAAVLGLAPIALAVAILGASAVRLMLRDTPDALDGVLGGFVLAGAPWLLGYVVLANALTGGQGLTTFMTALLGAATYAGVFRGSSLIAERRLSVGANVLTLFQMIAISVLILTRQPIFGAAVALLLLPQVMLQPLMLRLGDGDWYLRRVQGFAMLAMLTMAAALAI